MDKNNEKYTEISKRALDVLEKRNLAFRILYDTVLGVSDAKEGEVFSLLCRDLRRICDAEICLLLSYNPVDRTLCLESINSVSEPVLSDISKEYSVTLSDDQIDFLKNITIQQCSRDDTNFLNLFLKFLDPDTFLKKQCRIVSCCHEDKILAVGILQFTIAHKLKMRDMIDTYLSTMSIVIQRLNSIKDLRGSNTRFRAFLENSPMGVMVINSNKEIVDVNSYALEILNLEKKDVIGQTCYECVCLDNKDRCPVFDGGVKVDRAERVISLADGRKITILKSVRSIEIDGEKLAVETFIDISDMKKTEEERFKLEKQLYQSQKLEAIGTLSAGIAHEINTPIQFVSDNTAFVSEAFLHLVDAINSYQKLVVDCSNGLDPSKVMDKFNQIAEDVALDYLREEVPLAIQQAQEGLARVGEIVGAMKKFSYMGTMTKSLSDINDAVKNTVLVTFNEWKHFVEVNMDLDPDLPEILCHISDINQVLMNLVMNSTHAVIDVVGQQSTVKGNIGIKTYTEDDNIIIAVSDTGSGIPKKIQDQVFNPFFTTKPIGQGTGQGLSMVYNVIVEKHGGTVSFDSKEGQGSTFFLSLPI